MEKTLVALTFTTVLVTPGFAVAAPVNVELQMANYYGPPAYFAVYLTKPDGSYQSTLLLAGSRSRYLRELSGWVRSFLSSGQQNIDGVTGASVGAGQNVNVSVDIADSLIDAGYTVHVDSAVEHSGADVDEIVVPLDSGHLGAPQNGNGFVRSLRLSR